MQHLHLYPNEEHRLILTTGFQHGFSLRYNGPQRARSCVNMPSAQAQPLVLANKVIKEISAGRVLGPCSSPPIDYLQCSPLGLVPKKGDKNKWRMIHNLSHPHGDSINSHISKADSSVNYQSFDRAIELIRLHGANCYMAKSDLDSAFRQIPMDRGSLPYLGFMLGDLYFIDTCLPFGAASSCAIFEVVSSYIHWLTVKDDLTDNLAHYLDDFFMVHSILASCRKLLSQFSDTCKRIGFPVSKEKTEGPVQNITFLGLTLDTVKMLILIPQDKLEDAVARIQHLVKIKKCKVRELSSLTGLLNFLTRAIKPGRPFLRRLYTAHAALPNHFHISITKNMKQDLHTWRHLFSNTAAYRPILPDPSPSVTIFTDATAKSGLGFGAICEPDWLYGIWPSAFLLTKPSIELLELFPIVLAIETWQDLLANQSVLVYSDNQAAVQVTNNLTSSCHLSMGLVRRLALTCMSRNILLNCEYLPGELNSTADSISRLQWQKFRQLKPRAAILPTPPNQELWPISVQLLEQLKPWPLASQVL